MNSLSLDYTLLRRARAASLRARKAAASPRGPRQAAGLGSQGGFAARGFAATHGHGHVRTTINIEINAKNFHGSLTTVVRAQNDTPKTANITCTIFDRTLV